MKTFILAGVLALTGGTGLLSDAAAGQAWDQPPHADRDEPYWGERRDERKNWGYEGSYGTRPPAVRSGGGRPVIESKAPEMIVFTGNFAPNSIVIDTAGRTLYYILSSTKAYRYPIAVGREGFSWTGTEVIRRKEEWPNWYPPKEMIARDPRLPNKMTGGLRNPLGALALYLGNTIYRIHGTNDASSIGRATSLGCFRMRNEHVVHLASIAPIGTRVVVMKSLEMLPTPPPVAQNMSPRVSVAPPRAKAPAEPPVAREDSTGSGEDGDYAEHDDDQNYGERYEGHRGPHQLEESGGRLSKGSRVSLHAF